MEIGNELPGSSKLYEFVVQLAFFMKEIARNSFELFIFKNKKSVLLSGCLGEGKKIGLRTLAKGTPRLRQNLLAQTGNIFLPKIKSWNFQSP